jgi:hypothetical protein
MYTRNDGRIPDRVDAKWTWSLRGMRTFS